MPRQFIILSILVLGIASFFLYTRKNEGPGYCIVRIGKQKITSEVASTPSEISKGLSGRNHLEKDSGLLFVFGSKGAKPSFWMKDMNFPIDIIWIKNGAIVGIEKDVPNPTINTPTTDLALYPAPSEITHVLEVNSGFSDKYGIKTGDNISLNKHCK